MRGLLILLAAAVPAIGLSQTVVTKTPYGTVPAIHDLKLAVSLDGQHLAVLKSSGSRRLVTIDGVDGEIFDSIEPIGTMPKVPGGTVLWSPVVFSPNGKRYAYGATRGGERFVIVDGKRYPWGRHFIFSPDSSRFAYYTEDTSSGAKFTVVLDGVESQPYDRVANLMFSDDGKRFIYEAGINGAPHLIVDGKATAAPGGIHHLKMSPNGKRYGYITRIDQSLVPVIDGVAQKNAARPSNMGDGTDLQISADGSHWAVTTTTRGNDGYTSNRVVTDGKAGPAYTKVSELQFSPDGKRYGYVAALGKRDTWREFLVIDGKKVGLEYREIRGLKFSPDSKRFVAQASTDAGAFLIIDGQESEAFIQSVGDFRFSNSGRYTFIGRPKGESREKIYVDGKAVEGISEMSKGTLDFSPDGNRLIFVGRTPKEATYLDGKILDIAVVNMGTQFSTTQTVFSPDSKHLAYMGNKDGSKLNIYVDGNPGVMGLQYSMPTFSVDGKHFAVAGRVGKAGNKWSVFVNGKSVVEVDDFLGEYPNTWKFDADGKLHVIARSDKQYIRYTIDPQGSSLDSFTANMSKNGKTGGSVASSGSDASSTSSTTVASNTSNEADQQMTELEKKQAEMQQKIEEMQQKAKKSNDKKMKKLKEITDIFK